MDRTTLMMAMTALADPKSNAGDVAKRLGITTSTLYDYLNGDRSLKAKGQNILDQLNKD
jgi:predicted transcriptional regulator